MAVHDKKLPLAVTSVRLRHGGSCRGLLLAAGATFGMACMLQSPTAHAQQNLPAWNPLGPQYVQCPAPGQPIIQIPEIVSQSGKLQGTILLSNATQRMYIGSGVRNGNKFTPDPSQCLLQDVRQFKGSVGGVAAPLPGYAGTIPSAISSS
jgi:hypothetical protein